MLFVGEAAWYSGSAKVPLLGRSPFWVTGLCGLGLPNVAEEAILGRADTVIAGLAFH